MSEEFNKTNHHFGFHGDSLAKREVQGFTLREIIHRQGVQVEKHFHENAHVGFVLRGFFTERCEGKNLECHPLNVSYLAPGASHSDHFRTTAHCFVLEIMPQRFNTVQEYLRLNEPVMLSSGFLSSLTLRLYNEIHRTDSASQLAIEGLSLEILSELSRKSGKPEPKRPRWLKQARELIHAHFSETLTHDRIAETVGVHPAHLADVFRQHFHCTIGEYIRDLRIEFACREISESESALCDIALAAGFYDQSHFTKIFKKFTGMTPAQYQANLKNPAYIQKP